MNYYFPNPRSIYFANLRQSWHLHSTHFAMYDTQWRHNDCDGISKHRRLDCLVGRLSKRKLKKVSNKASLLTVLHLGTKFSKFESVYNISLKKMHSKMSANGGLTLLIINMMWLTLYTAFENDCTYVKNTEFKGGLITFRRIPLVK